ncbi:MAG: gamma-glutamylcyclotransferase [Alphaproteobacteria bacterium]|jgi:cation transport protein ChaC|nr:gamma-glutamylcyclotransferase [Alphaproteobacteria bacterium]
MAAQHWVFGYGSLMWQPDFPYIERRAGLLRGWHRAHALRSTLAWGSTDRPGLILTLLSGGECLGTAFRVPAGQWWKTRGYLRQREVAYRHVQVQVDTPEGTVSALTFAADPRNPRFIGKQPLWTSAQLVAQGEGRKGTSRGYLAGTIAAVRAMGGQPEPSLQRLQGAVNVILGREAAKDRT